jgi:hypothetical protein
MDFTRFTIKHFPIAVAGSASANIHEIVPALAGHRISLLAYVVTADDACEALWRSADDDTNQTGNVITEATRGAVAPANQYGWFKTAEDEALNLYVDGAANLGGHVTVAYEPVA